VDANTARKFSNSLMTQQKLTRY